MEKTGKKVVETAILRIENIRQTLERHYGTLNWWPGDSPDEVAIGAVLTQNTNWSNVEKAIVRMKRLGLISFPAILSAETAELAKAIRPAGYFNQKARKLKELAKVVCRDGNKTIRQFFHGKTMDTVRTLLTNVWGIGLETADAILLYAGGYTIFVVDAYTKRIFFRHGIVDQNTDYEEVRKMVEQSIPSDTAACNEFHAALVHLGKDFCHRQTPDCSHCPLTALPRRLRETGE